MKNLDQDVELLVDVFNDAWSDNWGFVPVHAQRGEEDGGGLQAAAHAGASRASCSIDGEPAAVALAIPNLNELVRDLDGKLFPLGLPKLLWRLKVRGPEERAPHPPRHPQEVPATSASTRRSAPSCTPR